MESLLVSTGVVAISEIGDKTQLLALLLATRFRQPVPIILGIFVATVLNHAVAALAGRWVAVAVDPDWLRWGVAILFLGMAGWVLIPDRIEEGEVKSFGAHGAFLATTVAFFLAEMGDKTQIATAALAARFETVVPVVIGTTVGMLIADVPAVLCGHAFAHKIDSRWVRYVAAAIFAALGLTMVTGVKLPI
jgi:putative Ca2+/H+ antiporter (TMEM165/GDT1 family)